MTTRRAFLTGSAALAAGGLASVQALAQGMVEGIAAYKKRLERYANL